MISSNQVHGLAHKSNTKVSKGGSVIIFFKINFFYKVESPYTHKHTCMALIPLSDFIKVLHILLH